MMTNERIKEEFEKWEGDLLTDTESYFIRPYKGRFMNQALGFHAGFKTAERLAKIEVLEELLSFAEDQGLTVIGVKAFARTMIKELKEK